MRCYRAIARCRGLVWLESFSLTAYLVNSLAEVAVISVTRAFYRVQCRCGDCRRYCRYLDRLAACIMELFAPGLRVSYLKSGDDLLDKTRPLI